MGDWGVDQADNDELVAPESEGGTLPMFNFVPEGHRAAASGQQEPPPDDVFVDTTQSL